MPSFKSFISRTSVRKIGFGISSRGSREGFSSSSKMSLSVISPIPNSAASLSVLPAFFESPLRFPISSNENPKDVRRLCATL